MTMSNSNLFQQTQAARLNLDRARAFGRPVLRSLHPDAALVGHSVTTIDGEDVVLESNQLLRSTLNAAEPTSFTCRTFKSWSDADAEWALHNVDHLMNTHLQYRKMEDPRAANALLTAALNATDRSDIDILVNHENVHGTMVVFQDSVFVQFFLGSPEVMITIAAPTGIIEAGFTTDLGND